MDTPTFGDIAKLSDREVQILMREVYRKDLVIALVGTGEPVRRKCFGNMSERVRTLVQEEMARASGVRKDEIGEAQGRIVQAVMALVEQGHVTWPPQTKQKSKAKRKPGKQHTDMKRRLRTEVARRLDEMSNEEINGIFRNLAEIARADGILALEAFAEKMGDPFSGDR